MPIYLKGVDALTMAKKLMAILGANVYQKATYEFDMPGKQVEPYTTYYSTAAVAKALFNGSRESDNCYVVVFLTEMAQKNNWENRLYDFKEKLAAEKEGLKYELIKVAPRAGHKTVRIKDGKDTYELWSIVNTLLEEIEDGDEVYLDITTGFRSIPLLSLLVINYARIVKNNVKIKGIYYGAFEAKNEITNHTPVFDLWPMIEVADWSYAIHSFFKHGSAGEISDLLDGSKGNTYEESNRNFSELGKLLQQFSDNIHMTRGYDLIFQYDYEKLKKHIGVIKSNNETGSYPVAKGLIERINKTVNHYGNDDIANGFNAVKWCIEHNLIHQGFILLQETVVTCLIAMAGLEEKKFINNYKLRSIFKRAIEIRYNPRTRNCQTLTINMINSMMKDQLKRDNIISGLCNLWSDMEESFNLPDNVKNLIKNDEVILVNNYGYAAIDNNFVKMFIDELEGRSFVGYMPKDKADSLIGFVGKCLTGFAKINGMDIKYSCLMQELSKVRNNLAHGGFNDREISEIINFRKKWNPISNLLKKDISKISFIDILKDICGSMEDIVNYAR